jgi:hypothetical protein
VEFSRIPRHDTVQNDTVILADITSGNHDFVTTSSQLTRQKCYLQLGTA